MYILSTVSMSPKEKAFMYCTREGGMWYKGGSQLAPLLACISNCFSSPGGKGCLWLVSNSETWSLRLLYDFSVILLFGMVCILDMAFYVYMACISNGNLKHCVYRICALPIVFKCLMCYCSIKLRRNT